MISIVVACAHRSHQLRSGRSYPSTAARLGQDNPDQSARCYTRIRPSLSWPSRPARAQPEHCNGLCNGSGANRGNARLIARTRKACFTSLSARGVHSCLHCGSSAPRRDAGIRAQFVPNQHSVPIPCPSVVYHLAGFANLGSGLAPTLLWARQFWTARTPRGQWCDRHGCGPSRCPA